MSSLIDYEEDEEIPLAHSVTKTLNLSEDQICTRNLMRSKDSNVSQLMGFIFGKSKSLLR